MPTYQLPNDDPPKSLPTLTKEQKQKCIIALQESLNRSMGYTIENKLIVIWTSKVWVADDEWPNDDEGSNYTYFYKNLSDKEPFLILEARIPEHDKMRRVAEELKIFYGTFCLKSKKAHLKQYRQKK